MYGAASEYPKKEDDELNPLTAYARSKVAAEKDLEPLADNNFSITCLRFATACGFTNRLRLDLVLNDFVAGALVRRSSAPGRRLKSVLWAASVLGTATTAGLLATGLFDAKAAAVALSASASALVIAGITWMLNKSALGNVILLLAIIASATSLIAVINDNTHSSFYGLAVWAIGVAWTILSWAGYAPPARSGMVVGSAAALVGAQMTATEPYRPQGLTLAVITVILILVSGARLGRIGLLITGAIGGVGFSVQVHIGYVDLLAARKSFGIIYNCLAIFILRLYPVGT